MSEDWIRRSDAIKAIAETIADDGDTSAWLYVAEDMLKGVPSADRPSGEWMPKNSYTMYCDVCGFEEVEWRTQDYGYCPNCGARMKGTNNGEDIQSTDE